MKIPLPPGDQIDVPRPSVGFLIQQTSSRQLHALLKAIGIAHRWPYFWKQRHVTEEAEDLGGFYETPGPSILAIINFGNYPIPLLNLARIGVVIELETQLEILSPEFGGQRREGIGICNSAPGGAVQGDISRGKDHLLALHAAIFHDGEFNRPLSFFYLRRTRRIRNQVVPLHF